MQSHPHRPVPQRDLRRRLERLTALPLRPALVRWILERPTGTAEDVAEVWEDSPKFQSLAEIDPGWTLWKTRGAGRPEALELIAESAWWLGRSSGVNEALQRLWRHSVAVSLAARRLAREAGDADPARVADAGLLHGLGRWAVATLDPEWISQWLAEPDLRKRRERELRSLGTDLSSLGRSLAERWGCDPLVADAAWLHADGGELALASTDPARLGLIQEAYRLAERSVWTLREGEPHAPAGSDPRVRLLTAEVQIQCASALAEPDATAHEERLARSNAALRCELAKLRARQSEQDRFLQAYASTDPGEPLAAWAERAGRLWCEQPGISAARVVWRGSVPSLPGAEPAAAAAPPPLPAPNLVIPLLDRRQACAEIQLWVRDDVERPVDGPGALSTVAVWQAWAAALADRARLERKLEAVLGVHRDWREAEEPRARREKLDALGEFAAGAGHEINNPLAVIMGRAQLLLAQATDPAAVRSLRAIIAQAQRAHRILRDLMYVARPPEPRPRFMLPEEIIRSCLRDLRADADAREVRLVVESREAGSKVWADPDALRHLIEILVRNALEATPKGGTVRVVASGDSEALRWTVQDNGRGIDAEERPHLFDPFYCGRQAGRGLGLGLPRAARIVSQVGGSLRWHSSPGQGSVFQVHLPLAPAPRPPQAEAGVE